jgi:hypothetical protein
MNVLCIRCSTIPDARLIFGPFYQGRFPIYNKNHLVGFWCIKISLGAKMIKGGKLRECEYFKDGGICIDFVSFSCTVYTLAGKLLFFLLKRRHSNASPFPLFYLPFYSRIVGGSVAVEGSVPWQACGLTLLRRELWFLLSVKKVWTLDPFAVY